MVADQVIGKFTEIEKDLQAKIEVNDSIIDSLVNTYSENEKVVEIHNQSNEMRAYIMDFRKKLIKFLQQKSNTEVINLSDYDSHSDFIIGTNSNGEGYLLEQNLDAYIDSINQISDSFNFSPITEVKDGNDFVESSFKNTPTAAVLAILSEFHLEVTGIEIEAITELAKE